MPTLAMEATAAASDTLLSSSHGIETFILAALSVLAAYGHLLIISMSYIKLALIPVIMLAFIGAVACKFYYSNSSGGWQHYYGNNSEQTGFANRVEMLVASVPQLVQLLCSGLDNYFVGLGQQQKDSFLISHFLFFSSSSIGALRVMMVTLRVAKVSEVLRMTFTVLLNIALHAKVAEWVGEDMVLVCMPELIAALLWFFDHFDHGGYTKCIIDNVISFESGEIIGGPFEKKIILGAAVILPSMFAYESSMFRVLVSCTLSGILSHFSMWMISGTDESAKLPIEIQLLKCSAHVCFGISAIWVSVLAILHLRPETGTSFIYVEEAHQMSVLIVFGCLMLGLSFLFVDLGNKIGGGAPSSASSRPLLLSSIRREMEQGLRQEIERGLAVGRRGHRTLSWLMVISILTSWLAGQGLKGKSAPSLR